MTDELIELLKKELKLQEDAAKILQRSYEICKKIGEKESYKFDELDHLEALTSRFARLGDILTQKMFRITDQLDLETPGTVRDRLNRAEKKGLISSAETFAKIRLLRTEIAHEYMPDEIRQIYMRAIKWTPELLDAVERVKEYAKKFISQNS